MLFSFYKSRAITAPLKTQMASSVQGAPFQRDPREKANERKTNANFFGLDPVTESTAERGQSRRTFEAWKRINGEAWAQLGLSNR